MSRLQIGGCLGVLAFGILLAAHLDATLALMSRRRSRSC
jgi:hypothetical protein